MRGGERRREREKEGREREGGREEGSKGGKESVI